MPEPELRQDSLVLYKNRPARVAQVVDKKLVIQVEGGPTVSVRPKDVTLLHPGPLRSLSELRPPAGDVMTAWELLAGETSDLRELAELAFGAYTPAAAWAAWQVVSDALYFSGTPERIVAHDEATVAREQDGRETRAAADQAWSALLARLDAGGYAPEDEPFLAEVVALALGQREQSRLLRALGQGETPANAHALLLRIGYWDETVDPYPARAGVTTAPAAVGLDALLEETRRDLTHRLALAIDDEGSHDPDDALSLEGDRLWVHVADAAALVPPDSPADLEARTRGANLYLPEGTVRMLPPEATDRLALGLAEISPALSFGLDLDLSGEVAGVEIVPSWVRVGRLTYEEAEARLDESPLRELDRLARAHEARRRANGAIEIELPEVKVRLEAGEVDIRPLPPLRSRALVREAMLMAGAAVARFALTHDLPLPFTSQEPPLVELPPASTPAEMFARRRLMRPGQQSTIPDRHAGLGLDDYAQATSPLRRYLDLVVHQQLRAFLAGRPLMDARAILERIGAADAVVGSVRWAERRAIQHWTLVYLLRRPAWEGDAVLVERQGAYDRYLIPALALETELYRRQERPLDSVVRLAFQEANLPQLQARFRLIG